MDRTTLIATIGTLGLLAGVIFAGAGYEALVFLRGPALAFVVGGALLTTWMAIPAGRSAEFLRLVRRGLAPVAESPRELVILLVALTEIARRDGMLALERPVSSLDDGFVKRTVRLAIDGTDPGTIESVGRAEMESTDLRHTAAVQTLESAGRSAPVFGMMGTLIGLVIMLGRLEDPAAIGPGMAVALLTTLYGLLFAHVVCFPLARKLTLRNSDELLSKTIVLKGVLALQAGDHPRTVDQKLRAYLPDDAFGPSTVAGSTLTAKVVATWASQRQEQATAAATVTRADPQVGKAVARKPRGRSSDSFRQLAQRLMAEIKRSKSPSTARDSAGSAAGKAAGVPSRSFEEAA